MKIKVNEQQQKKKDLLRLYLSARVSKIVKIHIKPIVCALVFLVIFRAYLFTSETFFERFSLRCRAVFVRAAQEQRIVAFHATKSALK
jgi:hypothetical protein